MYEYRYIFDDKQNKLHSIELVSLKDLEAGKYSWIHLPTQTLKIHAANRNTGRTDKYQRPIFEGDIISFFYEEDLSSGTYQGSVQWNDDGYWEVLVEDKGFSTALFSDKIDIEEIEIKGNIYEQKDVIL